MALVARSVNQFLTRSHPVQLTSLGRRLGRDERSRRCIKAMGIEHQWLEAQPTNQAAKGSTADD